MRVVTADEIDGALTFPALIEALRAAFRGGYEAPDRHHHHVPRREADATLLLMPAWSAPFIGVKVLNVFPDNASRSMPSVIGTYLLMDGTDGRPLAALDGTRLTLWRTAAASALAADRLARPEAERLLLVGAGALAPFLARAHASVRPIRHVSVWARRPDAAEAVAAELRVAGLAATPARDLASEVAAADIVSCATLSQTPLVMGDWLREGTHVDLVGAFTPSMREADDRALARASVFVDTPACLYEGGDVTVAIRAGTFEADQVRGNLFDLASGRLPGRETGAEITLFKSIGASIEDLAAAAAVWEKVGS